MASIAKLLIFVGLTLMSAGMIVWILSKTPLDRLGGDIVVRRHNFTFVFPLATCIILSIVLTVVLWIISRLKH